MPDGYKCNRCGSFTETGRFGCIETRVGPVRRVVVHPSDSDEGDEAKDYTLCDRCRDELVNWVGSYD